MEIFRAIVNNALYVTILVIVLSSVVNFYIKSRARDRCLRDFDQYRVALETRGGKVIWGALRAYSSGLELLYDTAHQDIEGHVENSYILYDNEIGTMQALYRFHNQQSEKAKRTREQDIRRTYQPNLFRRASRALRNLFNAFKDAIVQALNALLGQRAAQNPQDLVLAKHKELTSSGAQLLSGAVGNAYEPILERYIGQYVVIEIVRGDKVVEEYGILKEYSATYVELLNVKLEVPLAVYLQYRPSSAPAPVTLEREGGAICVSHALQRTLVVEAVQRGEERQEMYVPIDPGKRVSIEAGGDGEESNIKLDLSVHCMADLIVPRALAVIRHAGKREKLSLETLIGLDEFPNLPWLRRLIDVRAWRRQL